MVYVSFIEIFQKSVGAFSDHGVDDSNANLYATLCFFAGIVTESTRACSYYSR